MKAIRTTKYDVANLAWPASRNAVIGLLSRAKIKIGYCDAYSDKAFYIDFHSVSSRGMNDKRKLQWQPKIPFHGLPGKAIEYVGGNSGNYSKSLLKILPSKMLNAYIVFHLFSRMQNRSLSKKNAGKLIKEVAKRTDRPLKIIGWGISDTIGVKQITDEYPTVDFIGNNSLMDDVAIIQGAQLLVCIDSGIMHLGEAYNVPIIGIFGPTEPDISLSKQTVYSSIANLSCTPFDQRICGNYQCPLENHCLDSIDIERLSNEISIYLNR